MKNRLRGVYRISPRSHPEVVASITPDTVEAGSWVGSPTFVYFGNVELRNIRRALQAVNRAAVI